MFILDIVLMILTFYFIFLWIWVQNIANGLFYMHQFITISYFSQAILHCICPLPSKSIYDMWNTLLMVCTTIEFVILWAEFDKIYVYSENWIKLNWFTYYVLVIFTVVFLSSWIHLFLGLDGIYRADDNFNADSMDRQGVDLGGISIEYFLWPVDDDI